MPTYDIGCAACGAEAEHYIPLADYAVPLARCECGGERRRLIRASYVVGDIEPYQAMGVDIATGDAPRITSRAKHREYLKRNGFVEVGNEPIRPRAEAPPDRAEISRQVKETIDRKGIKL